MQSEAHQEVVEEGGVEQREVDEVPEHTRVQRRLADRFSLVREQVCKGEDNHTAQISHQNRRPNHLSGPEPFHSR